MLYLILFQVLPDWLMVLSWEELIGWRMKSLDNQILGPLPRCEKLRMPDLRDAVLSRLLALGSSLARNKIDFAGQGCLSCLLALSHQSRINAIVADTFLA